MEEFGSAKEAAVRWVGDVGRVGHFLCGKNLQGEVMFFGEGDGGLIFGAGQTRGIAEDAGNACSQHLISGEKKESGVDAAGVGDEG